MIAGQGTLGLELAEQLARRETFLLPIGGGGLASGIAIALRALRPGVRLVGVQAGKHGAGTIADGIAVKHPGELTMSILDELLDDIVHVDDEEIAEAITLLLERSKLVVEGAGAASVAALLAGKAGGTGDVCALLSGRQHRPDAADLGDAPRPDARRPLPRPPHARPRPARRAAQAARARRRPSAATSSRSSTAAKGWGSALAETGVELTLVTRDEEHCGELCAALEAGGYEFERLR